MNMLFEIYDKFLSIFPEGWAGVISLILVIIIIVSIYQIILKRFIWVIVLVILIPASIPILAKLWDSVISLIMYLLGKSTI